MEPLWTNLRQNQNHYVRIACWAGRRRRVGLCTFCWIFVGWIQFEFRHELLKMWGLKLLWAELGGGGGLKYNSSIGCTVGITGFRYKMLSQCSNLSLKILFLGNAGRIRYNASAWLPEYRPTSEIHQEFSKPHSTEFLPLFSSGSSL